MTLSQLHHDVEKIHRVEGQLLAQDAVVGDDADVLIGRDDCNDVLDLFFDLLRIIPLVLDFAAVGLVEKEMLLLAMFRSF